MTVHKIKMCACGHGSDSHEGGKGRCRFGADVATAICVCPCLWFHRRPNPAAYIDEEAPQRAPASSSPATALLSQEPEVLAAIDMIIAGLTRLRKALPVPPATSRPPATQPTVGRRDVKPENVPKPRRAAPKASTAAGDDKLTSAERKVLTALAQNIDGLTKAQLALISGYSAKSGGFRNTLSTLRVAGRMEGNAERLIITASGVADLGDFEPLPRGRELLEHWKRVAGDACARRLLDELAAAFPERLAKETLAERAGYQATSGGFRNALSRLRTLELMDGRRGELLSLAPTLADEIRRAA